MKMTTELMSLTNSSYTLKYTTSETKYIVPGNFMKEAGRRNLAASASHFGTPNLSNGPVIYNLPSKRYDYVERADFPWSEISG